MPPLGQKNDSAYINRLDVRKLRSYSLHRLTDFTIIYQLFNYMLNITKQTSELNPLIAKFILQFDYRLEEN